MGHLFLVRHATTAASAEGRNLGQLSDPPLTDDGKRLAQRTAGAIRAELALVAAGDVRLVTSPARRCRETARAIRSALATLERSTIETLEPGLHEIAYGAWEGLTPAECLRRDPELRSAWEADPYTVPAPGGESGADVAARSFPVMEELDAWLSGSATRVAIVVAHNHVIRLRLAALLGMPLRDYRRRLGIEPGSYSAAEIALPQDRDTAAATIRRLGVVPLPEAPAKGSGQGGIYNA